MESTSSASESHVAAAAGLLKLLQFGQVGHKEECKARALQFQSIALAAGGYDFADFYIAFCHLVLALGQCVVRMNMVIGAVAGLIDLFTGCLSIVGKGGLFHIPTLIRIGGRDVVVTHSEFVRKVTGVDNVCERAAILAAGEDGRLLMPKQCMNRVTIAVAEKKVRIRI